MKQKTLAILSDILLVVLVLGGVAWLLVAGTAPAGWTSDKTMLPLSEDGSRILLLLTAAAGVLGLILAVVLPRRPERLVNGRVVRYAAFERLVHWSMALGYVLAFGSAALLLRWVVYSTVDTRPTLYAVHFVGAGLMVVAGTVFVAAARVQGKDALFPRWNDVPAALARLFGYLGVYGQSGVLGLRLPRAWQPPLQQALAAVGIRPAAREGKFLSVEKVLSFTPLALLTLTVIVTGLIKAARYFFAVSPDVYGVATTLHDFATIATVVVVGAHLAAIFLVPRNWAGIGAMITGRIGIKAVEEEFPAWADSLAAGSGGAPAAPRRRPAVKTAQR